MELTGIIDALKRWREAVDKHGVDSKQARKVGATAMRLLFEGRDLLPESQQRIQLRGFVECFTIDEVATMTGDYEYGFYANPDFIADLEKHHKPKNLITIAVATKEFSVSTPTIKRRIKEGKIKSYREEGSPDNGQHLVDAKEIASRYPRRR